MRVEPTTTISEGNAQFIRTCLDGLVAFHAQWGVGAVQVNVTLQVSVNASMLFRDEDKDAEMTVELFHGGKEFLKIASGEHWPESLCWAEECNRESEGCLFGRRCRPEELSEIIRSALERHLQRNIAALGQHTRAQEALLERLREGSPTPSHSPSQREEEKQRGCG